MEEKKRKIIIFGIVLISIILLVMTLISYTDKNSPNPGWMRRLPVQQMQEDNSFVYFLVGFIIIAIVGMIFYFMTEDKKEEKPVEKIKKNTKITLNFLSKDEKKIVEKIIEEGGKTGQYELSHLEGLSKVKVHRILQNLEKKGVIHKEKFGKVNKIALNKEIYETLKD